MEYIEISNKYVLVHDSENVISKFFLKYGKLFQSETGNREYVIKDSQEEIDDYVIEHNLLPVWEEKLTWDFDTNFRFKISQKDLIADNDLFALLQYAKTQNDIQHVFYANLIIIYVNFFAKGHRELLESKNILIEEKL